MPPDLPGERRNAATDTLRKMADRIQARAIDRCGELLKAIEPGKPGPRSVGASPPISRAQAARDAGLSRDQRHTALRVASIPRDEFERLVESDDPPTVTELARRGTTLPLAW